MAKLREELRALLERVDLNHKLRDAEHLFFNSHSSRRILNFRDFIASLGPEPMPCPQADPYQPKHQRYLDQHTYHRR